jgi:hypothetical protein
MVDVVRLYGPEASNSSLPALGAADHTKCSQSEVVSTPPTNSTESASDAWSTVACSEECLGPGPGPWIRRLLPRVQPFTSGQYNTCPTTPNQLQCKTLILLGSCACDDLDDGLLQKAPNKVVSPRLPLAPLPQKLPCRRADEDGTGHIMALS